MKPKIFIDGQWGTTGLLIEEKLSQRNDLELKSIAKKDKKKITKKLSIIQECDLVILCLPNDAAKKMASLITNKKTKIIDASTAHRIDPSWSYGFPEMTKNQREIIKNSRKVANVGCYASAIIALLYPILAKSIINIEHYFTLHAICGYSGGGRQLIETYTKQDNPSRIYALEQNHKHIPEIMKFTTLKNIPYFSPSVGNFLRGMIVQIPLFDKDLQANFSIEDIYDCYQKHYEKEKFIQVSTINDNSILRDGCLDPTICNYTNQIKIGIYGNKKIFSLVAILDNLGKGASGSAIQNLNLMLNFEEHKGLV